MSEHSLDNLLLALKDTDIAYEVGELRRYKRALLEKFAPFHIGDRVKFCYSYDPARGTPYYDYRETVVKGAKATVVGVDYTQVDQWSLKLRFDTEIRTSAFVVVREKGISPFIFNADPGRFKLVDADDEEEEVTREIKFIIQLRVDMTDAEIDDYFAAFTEKLDSEYNPQDSYWYDKSEGDK